MRISDWSSDVCSSDLPWATDEQYDLLRRYLAARHPGGGMASMDEGDYADMVEQSPVTSFVNEYREPAAAGEKGRLVCACLTHRQADGLSMNYSFLDPDHAEPQGLRNFLLMVHTRHPREVSLATSGKRGVGNK